MTASSNKNELNEEELASVAGWIFDGIADNKAHDSWTDKMWTK